MSNLETADFYTDESLMADPHSYFHFLRAKAPVTRLPYRNAVAVTGYDETIEVMLDAEHFSSINAVNGAMTKLPFVIEGDEIEAQLEAARPLIQYADQIATENGERHANLRSLVATLFTPSRLKALDAILYSTANALIDEFVADGQVNLPRQYGGPYATLIISHLLGIPEKGRQRFREYMERAESSAPTAKRENPLALIGKDVYVYIARRRLMSYPLIRHGIKLFGPDTPTTDILTQLSLAKYPDGSKPSLKDLAALGAFLFAAGGDTTKLLLANAFRILAIRPDLQDQLRRNPDLVPNFVEEILRFDGSVKCAGRLCQKTTELGGMEIKAGTPILLSHMAANRDPRRFENPDEFRLDRPRAKEHLAFGRGPHTCIGAPLARREVVVSLERLLARMGNIRLSAEHHGARDNPHFEYASNATLRIMKGLHLNFDRI